MRADSSSTCHLVQFLLVMFLSRLSSVYIQSQVLVSLVFRVKYEGIQPSVKTSDDLQTTMFIKLYRKTESVLHIL